MLRHADYTQQRIRQLIERLESRIYPQRQPVEQLTVAGPMGRINYAEAQMLPDFKAAKAGDQYGPVWATFWFRASTTVPKEWAGKRVDFLWDTQSEATLWRDGESVQGLNMTHGDRPDAILFRKAKGGEAVSLQIEMACNNKFGVSESSGVAHGPALLSPYYLRRCEIAIFDQAAWDLYFDAKTLFDLYTELERDGDVSEKSLAGLLLSELNRFCNVVNVQDAATWPVAREILTALYKNKNGTRQFELSAIGHAHIDTAWLWPLAETHRKCERSFSTAVAYMEEYPEYRFACSQAYQYEVIKQRNPHLYERIKKAVKSGQWVIVGGTWIEPDCNIPSGEALCRQFLFGQRYFQKEFGVTCREFWNPDVFGYNGQLPQLMRLAGMTRFLTQKLSWNRFNRPQHHTFTWQGIDGSEVLAHFPPADTYNAFMNQRDYTHMRWVRDNAKLFKDHDRSNHGMMLYGFGDGGGGPTKPMFETLRRVKDLQGVPRTEQRTSDEFFTLLEANITDRPLQIGELYFEFHRGTYTSQGLVKRNNRKAEILLHDLEFLGTANRSTIEYPKAEIDDLWKTLLLNQFHDILPGSSIGEVYSDSAKQFEELFAKGEKLLAVNAKGGKQLVNTTGFDRKEVAEDGTSLAMIQAKPYAAATSVKADDAVTIETPGGAYVLTNKHLIVTIAKNGVVTSLIHRASGRESLDGEANVFEMYDDKPTVHDAWDVDPFHIETRRVLPGATEAKVKLKGALRAELEFIYAFGKSKMTLVIRLDAASPRIEFHCDVDWQEREQMLKVAHAVNARALNATYEMQFGVVERPTHYNNSFDLAKYEVPYHKWFDLSEYGFGCAVLSESKYGGSTFGNVMRLSLLRGPMSPDPECDRGQHTFAYALMPHAGGWREAGVTGEAYRFNYPLRHGGYASTESFAAIEDANVVLDTIKPAEEGAATVYRAYEAHGARGTARMKLAKPASHAVLCNILEEEGEALKIDNGQVVFDYTPYQIISIKVT
ncbi:MAG: hypothetical protein JWM57_2295 [Phycisphaerales bacterium]|nr:hypothetical protein [Phycisphaerales bacterium]